MSLNLGYEADYMVLDGVLYGTNIDESELSDELFSVALLYVGYNTLEDLETLLSIEDLDTASEE